MGRRFYYAVVVDVQMAVPWAEFEEMCYLFAGLHLERYGSFPATGSAVIHHHGRLPAGKRPGLPHDNNCQ